MSSNSKQETISGIDRDILERFLDLLRDKYHLADEANFFLEKNAHLSGINIAITNQRDVVSHLITLLTQENLSHDQQAAQLGNAEEHIRRAILEPYELTVNAASKNVLDLVKTYKKIVLPIRNEPGLTSGPDVTNIYARLREIDEHREQGRAAKRMNLWNSEWENGSKAFVDAFYKLKELEITLEKYIIRANQIRENRRNRLRWKFGIILAIIFGLIATL